MKKRLFVVDVNGFGQVAMLESDLDKICKKYDMQKTRITRPIGMGIVSCFPERIQYCKRMSWIQSIILCFKISYGLRYNLFSNYVKCGWAIED